jgi:hypothetical protein
MCSRRTSSVPKEDVVFPRMLYCDSRCSQTLTGWSLALPGALLCNVTRRLGDRQSVNLRQRVRGSVRAVRAVLNTRLFQKETRVAADGSIYTDGKDGVVTVLLSSHPINAATRSRMNFFSQATSDLLDILHHQLLMLC